MYDPFRRTRARANRQIRRATLTALNDAWGALLTPATPSKPKSPKKSVKSATAKRRQGRASTAEKPKSPGKARTAGRRGSFTTKTYENAFGTVSCKLYTPGVAQSGSDRLPLIVMLHGCGQSPDDFARGTGMNAVAKEHGCMVLYPAQARKSQLNRCWNWFKRENQVRGAGEPALIADLTRQIIADHPVDPAKVYVAGLSAGASAALVLATAYPDIFAAVGVHSGLTVGAAHDASSAATAMQSGNPGRRTGVKMPTIIFHGDADKVVSPRNGRFVAIRALEGFDSLDRTERTGRVAGGRSYERTVHRIGRGRPWVETWVINGAGHGWSGGNAKERFTDSGGPDASRAMMRFFLRHRTTALRRSNATGPT
ncbi:PHB depolymerase family esterase [Rhodobacteraceae bacterium KMM 6894]|nr:PHB depolymerase family esterase [Rhodobacteraceae bacterium KMM 6894]